MTKKDDENLNAILQETVNQFNYSSNLFDSLESKSSMIIISISIIIVVALNSYFLEKLLTITLFLRITYYAGILLVIMSLALSLNWKIRTFKLVSVEPLKEEYIENPKRDFRKLLIGKYIPVIEENFKHYSKKRKRLRFILYLTKIGSMFLVVIIFYMLILTNL